jgi:hypothetical protein
MYRTAFLVTPLVLLLAGIAGAVPITYTETANATGSLGSDSFTLAQIVLTFESDTTNATVIAQGIAYNFKGTAQINIPSLAITANLTDSTNMFSVKGTAGIDENSVELISTSNPSLNTYTLKTAVGPVPGATAVTFNTPFATSAGALVFSSISDSVFSAKFHPYKITNFPAISRAMKRTTMQRIFADFEIRVLITDDHDGVVPSERRRKRDAQRGIATLLFQ